MNRISIGAILLCVVLSAKGEPLAVPDQLDIEFPYDEPVELEVSLGKTLFFDTRLSENYQQSCATCHNPDLGFGDGLVKGLGANGNELGRNTPHLYNLAWNNTFFWDGRSSSLEDQALGPIQSKEEMNMSLVELIPRIEAVPYYRDMFAQAYGDAGITAENLARAIAAFERTIIVDDTPFDRFLRGDDAAMSPAAKRGMALFEGKANCIACHDGANLTDESFHNLGTGSGDMGRYAFVKSPEMRGSFKTPGLRNVLLTAPYMHDGSLGTLEEVIRFYDRGGDDKDNLDPQMKPLDLTEQEISDLVTFLGSLTQHLDFQRPVIPELIDKATGAAQ